MTSAALAPLNAREGVAPDPVGGFLPCCSSVSGLVALLLDAHLEVQESALSALLECVEKNWHEIADGLAVIEGLALDKAFPHRKSAALLAAKLMYNLDMIDDAVVQAMAAEELFDTQEPSEFSQTLIAKAIQRYCQDRQKQFEAITLEMELAEDTGAMEEALHAFVYSGSSGGKTTSKNECYVLGNGPTIDARLESLVERMLETSRQRVGSGEIEALGVALEALRLDKVREVILGSPQASELLKFCVEKSRTTISSRRVRQLFQKLIVTLYDTKFPTSSPITVKHELGALTRALFLVEDCDRVAQILGQLVRTTDGSSEEIEENALIAYQIAFDLVTFEDQPFLARLLAHPALLPASLERVSEAGRETVSGAVASGAVEVASATVATLPQAASPLKDTDKQQPEDEERSQEERGQGELEKNPEATSSSPRFDDNDAVDEDCEESLRRPLLGGSDEDTTMPAAQPQASCSVQATGVTTPTSANISLRIERLRRIISREATLSLTVDFLHRENRTDLTLLDQIKDSVDSRSSVTQNAIVICHALMQAGTTCDVFVRENLDWFGRAICWAKFTAAASNGVLHKGHISAATQVLSAYLPGSGGGPFSEGGALMALGLIHANHNDKTNRSYLLEQLQSAQTYCPQNYEPLQHGACLALGFLAMGSRDTEIYAALRNILFADSAISGEAAGLAMGLVALGSGSTSIAYELLGHAHDTEHERAVRGAALGAAFILYRKEEEAEPLLDQMAKDKNPMIRYGGMFAIGLAYCATSNRSALRCLLHVAVSDVSSDVRRAAVMALGFVACDSPEQMPRIVSLLADSFNPHVRYAAAIAVGVGCAGTGSLAAVDMLLPLTQDTTDFVRQGALLGLGLVLVQASLTSLPGNKVQKVRDLIVRIAADKHEDAITRFGAIISQGLIDAGGRNTTIGLLAADRSLRPESVVGLTLFCQLWFWYPLIISVALAFRPTALIGLNVELEPPSDFKVQCTAPAHQFAYIEPVKKGRPEEKKESISAVLSAASRRKQQEQLRKLAAAVAQAEKDTEMARPRADDDVNMQQQPSPPQQPSDATSPTKLSAPESAPISKAPLDDTHMLAQATRSTDAPHDGNVLSDETEDGPNPTLPKNDDAQKTVPATKDSAEESHRANDATPAHASPSPALSFLNNPCRVVPGQEKSIITDIPDNAWVPVDLTRNTGVILLRRRSNSITPTPSSDKVAEQ